VAAALWPGPLTLVLDRHPAVDWELGGADTAVGVRWPDDRLVADLARRVGPLAVTSANRHGEPTAVTAAEAAADLVGAVDLVIDGGPREGRSSTVVELADGRWAVLREGGVPTAMIAEVLERG
jgi:tRNA threonylcarbamoyl adenosine modification protein (Sua5/YciO/YrdC/YwlC family)